MSYIYQIIMYYTECYWNTAYYYACIIIYYYTAYLSHLMFSTAVLKAVVCNLVFCCNHCNHMCRFFYSSTCSSTCSVFSLSFCRCPWARSVPCYECNGMERCENKCWCTTATAADTQPMGQEVLGGSLDWEVGAVISRLWDIIIFYHLCFVL